ncbi:MAG: hypothetical protein P1U62_13580 [Alteraurantiacibacter sp. bin_em_oilr2.035]|jgi:hypothetical protein|nr:hypothetical protein [Alteraurantiacibacter sp. bin_em_oilr2.035]
MPRACPPGEALDRPWSGTTCKAAARVARASLALQVSRFAVRQPPYSGPDRAPADKERDIPVS